MQRPLQFIGLLGLFALDVVFLLHDIEYHLLNRSLPYHKTHYAVPLHPGIRIPINRIGKSFFFYTHILLGFLPLLLSLHNVSADFRKGQLKRHRLLGKVLLCSSFPSAILSIPLALTGKFFNPILNYLVLGFALLWILSMVMTYYYVQIGDGYSMDKHRGWGVRFMMYTHVVPVFSRLNTIVAWRLQGSIPFDEYEGGIDNLGELFWWTSAFVVTGCLIATEILVFYESNTASAINYQKKNE